MAERMRSKNVSPRIAMGQPPGRATRPGANLPLSVEDRRRQAADVEADFTGRPQPFGTYDGLGDADMVSAETAGYMELRGAAKDGGCDLVTVPGGVSAEKGCCNLFDPIQAAAEFNCRHCEHFAGQRAWQSEEIHD